MKVLATVITSSPGPTPRVSRISASPSVPEASPTQWSTPQNRANPSSKRSTFSPSTKFDAEITRSRAASSSSRSGACWAFRSRKGTARVIRRSARGWRPRNADDPAREAGLAFPISCPGPLLLDSADLLSHQNDIPEAQPGVLLDAVSGRLGDAASTVLADVRALRSGTVIYAGSTIGAGLETGHNVVIREENEIGAELSIWSNSSLDYGCTVGNPARVIGTVAELGERLDREGVWPPDDLPPKGETSPA